MPITIKLCNNIYDIPMFDEINIKQLIDLRKIDGSKPLELLTWAFGKEPILNDSKGTDRAIMNALVLIDALVNEIVDWMKSSERLSAPNEIEVLGVVVKFKPGLINELPYWGTVRCKNILNDGFIEQGENADLTDKIPEVLAHYLYALVTKGKYDEDKADEFIEVIETINFRTAIKAGNFFLQRQIRLLRSRQSYSHMFLMVTKKRLASMFSKSSEILTILKH